jgi:hypothetical protein
MITIIIDDAINILLSQITAPERCSLLREHGSIFDDSRCIIYDLNMIIVQATDLVLLVWNIFNILV